MSISNKLKIEFKKVVFALVLIFIQSARLIAQSKYSTSNKIILNNGRYHIKSGWVNSLGFSLLINPPDGLFYYHGMLGGFQE